MIAELVLKQRSKSLVLHDQTLHFDNRWYNAPLTGRSPPRQDDFENENLDLVDYTTDLLPISNLVFESLPTFDLLERLKIMQITVDQLKQIEKLARLTVLEIGLLLPDKCDSATLRKPFALPSVRTLCIKQFHKALVLPENLKFDTPSLETVCFGELRLAPVQNFDFQWKSGA